MSEIVQQNDRPIVVAQESTEVVIVGGQPNLTIRSYGDIVNMTAIWGFITGNILNQTDLINYIASHTIGSISVDSPLISTGGQNPTLSIQESGSSLDGYLSSADWNTFNSKQSALIFIDSIQNSSGTISLVGDLLSPGDSYYYGTNSLGAKGFYVLPSSMVYPGAGIAVSTGSAWATSLSQGNLTESTSSVLSISGGTNAVLGSGASIQVLQSGTSQDGYLSSTDWNTFNSKQPAGTYITSISISSSHGFAGSSSGGSTPTITLSTTATGILQGNGTSISAIVVGTGLSFSGGTLSATGAGSVTEIDTSSPLTGGPITSTGTIGITQSGTSTDGYLSSTDWNTFNNKQDTGLCLLLDQSTPQSVINGAPEFKGGIVIKAGQKLIFDGS